MLNERVVRFDCGGDWLIGIVHDCLATTGNPGILVVVGGPQYRVGSHRQFVLMARGWASAGYPVFRFDYRGMGDSEGARRSFDEVDEDIRSAVDAFMAERPELDGVIIFGLCDAASAALMYGANDARIRGLILANPWVRTPEGEARSFVRHYYGARLLQGSFWKKVFAGEFRVAESVRGFFRSIFLARRGAPVGGRHGAGSFIDRMLTGMRRFSRPILVLISEHDLTAQEFTDLCTDDARWKAAVAVRHVTCRKIEGADHTFSSRWALDEALRLSRSWIVDQKLQRA